MTQYMHTNFTYFTSTVNQMEGTVCQSDSNVCVGIVKNNVPNNNHSNIPLTTTIT